MGKLIVIEGLDGSGKSTQLGLLPKGLMQNGIDCKTVSFPDYSSRSSELVKMYLSGEFGSKPSDVNPYAASAFYTVDRYASYKTSWGGYYNSGGTVVAGRYTTSNAVHQTSKLPKAEWKAFLDWLYDFEYNKIAVPRPDCVVFLDMPVSVSQSLLEKRYSENHGKKDIHESDTSYLNTCREAALFTAEYSGWNIIKCSENGAPRPVESIADDILHTVLSVY